MCHADGSAPPGAPGAGEVAEAFDLHLTAADGARLMAYAARPEVSRGCGAVVLPDVRGLHDYYRGFARALAGAGVAAVAIDYYGRVLPDGPRDASMAEMFPLVGRLTPELVAADVAAATAHLRSEVVFTVGFCFGGSQAWIQSAFDHGLAGCAGFYGRPDDCRPFLDRMRPPLLLLVAGADAMTPVEDFRRFDAELAEAGVMRDMVVYDGAPHSFFDGGLAEHAEACEDAWRRLLEFIDERTRG